MPSTWRLAALQGITIATSIALCLTLAGMALRGDLETIARRTLLDDLGEYSALYEMQGTKGLDIMFKNGRHDAHEALRVTGPGGALLSGYQAQPADSFAWPGPDRLRHLSDVHGLMTVEHPVNDPHLLIGRIVLNDGAVLWFGRTDETDYAYLQNIKHYLWMAGIAAAIIALVPVFWYAGQVLQPVRSMIASAKALALGAGDERLAASSAVPELREFASAFNIALDRNSALTAELQAANDHLAHELRTPLARIRGNLENLLDTMADPAAKEAAARGVDEIDRASSLVQTILTVRAGEHGALKLHREPTSIRELLTDLTDLYVVSAEDKQQQLRLHAPEDVMLEIDQQRMTQAVANLLDNALAYTPAGGLVIVSLETSETTCTIRVQDTGPGIKPEEKARIWMRFIRGTAASARTPGMGLGLSLVQAVAHAHGGSAGCDNNEPSPGCTFWIKLPIAVS